MQITTIGLDLAKSIFQVHGVDAERPGCCSQVASAVADAAIFREVRGYVDKNPQRRRARRPPCRAADQFELNMKANTVRALGITIPPTLLARADEVLE